MLGLVVLGLAVLGLVALGLAVLGLVALGLVALGLAIPGDACPRMPVPGRHQPRAAALAVPVQQVHPLRAVSGVDEGVRGLPLPQRMEVLDGHRHRAAG